MAIIGYNEQEVKTLTDSFQAKSQEVTEIMLFKIKFSIK